MITSTCKQKFQLLESSAPTKKHGWGGVTAADTLKSMTAKTKKFMPNRPTDEGGIPTIIAFAQKLFRTLEKQ